MKTFFIALCLGIFIGSVTTAYFTNPEVFDDLVTKASEKTGVDSEQIDEFKEKAGEIIEKGVEKSKELAQEGTKATLATLVKTRLKAKDDVEAGNISVTVDKGVATLEGTVSSEEMQQQAVVVAKNTPGITEVDYSTLKIVPPAE